MREGGGRQLLLVQPQPLTCAGVLKALRALPGLAGTGAETRRAQKLAALLRAARGSESKWLVRTFVPHMAAGISLEASVLPALGGAAIEVACIYRSHPSEYELQFAKALARHHHQRSR